MVTPSRPLAYCGSGMNRRAACWHAAAGALAMAPVLLTAGCATGSGAKSAPGWLAASSVLIARGAAAGRAALFGEPNAALPARQIALTLADLPEGYQVADELVPKLDAARAAEDPWGRSSAYSVTFTGEAPSPWRDVVASVNAYDGTKHARAAFASWRVAVPPTYHRVAGGTDLGEEAAVYVRRAASPRDAATSLVGLRRGSVIASVAVSAMAGMDAPVDAAIALARVMQTRIERGRAAR